MNPRTRNIRKRIRKTIKWGGAAATVLLLVVWVVSIRWVVWRRDAAGNHLYIEHGRVCYSFSRNEHDGYLSSRDRLAECREYEAILRSKGEAEREWVRFAEWYTQNAEHTVATAYDGDWKKYVSQNPGCWFWFDWNMDSSGWSIKAPMWMPLVLMACLLPIIWRHDRRVSRREQGRCEHCGYSRHGLSATAVCPECGAPPTTPNVTAPASV